MDFRFTENLAQLRQGKYERCRPVSLGMLVIYFTWHISERIDACSEAHFEKQIFFFFFYLKRILGQWVIAVYLRL